MVSVASAGGDQDPPQGSGTVAANVLTSVPETRAIPVSKESDPIGNSQAIPENITGTTGMLPVSSSTAIPSLTGTSEIPHFATNTTSQMFTPRPPPASEMWRAHYQYGMPHSY